MRIEKSDDVDTPGLDSGVWSGTGDFPRTVAATTGSGAAVESGAAAGSTVGESPNTFVTILFSMPGLAVGHGTAGGAGTAVGDATTDASGSDSGGVTS